MGRKITKIIQKHDADANWDDANSGVTEHQIQPIRDYQGTWNGSIKYMAPSHDVATQVQRELNSVCLTTDYCQTRPTTDIRPDPHCLTPPPDDPRSKNAKEGRYCGPLSSYQ